MTKKADVAKEVKAKIKEELKREDVQAAENAEAKPAVKTEAKPAAKAEAKPAAKEAPKKEVKKVEEVLEEKVLTLPLKEAWKGPRKKRASAAIRVLREQLKRHIKKEIKFDLSVNKAIWKRGIKNPPRKIKLNVKIMKDSAKAYFIE